MNSGLIRKPRMLWVNRSFRSPPQQEEYQPKNFRILHSNRKSADHHNNDSHFKYDDSQYKWTANNNHNTDYNISQQIYNAVGRIGSIVSICNHHVTLFISYIYIYIINITLYL